MSRIGRMPVLLPTGVTVSVNGPEVTVKGSKGTLTQRLHEDMLIKQENGSVVVDRPTESQDHRSLHGLTRSLINNMVLGVSEGFSRRLEIEGVGYRAETRGDTLVLYLGYSHPVEIPAPPDVTFTVENRGRLVTIDGIDKQLIGELAATIRKQRPPEPYKGKNVRYQGEHIRRKAGKAGKV